MVSLSMIHAQTEPKLLQGNTIIIQMFTCANASIASVDNLGESDIFELNSMLMAMSKKYIDAMLENNKILAKLINQYLEAWYSVLSSIISSIDDCSYTYMLHK